MKDAVFGIRAADGGTGLFEVRCLMIECIS